MCRLVLCHCSSMCEVDMAVFVIQDPPPCEHTDHHLTGAGAEDHAPRRECAHDCDPGDPLSTEFKMRNIEDTEAAKNQLLAGGALGGRCGWDLDHTITQSWR